MQLRLEADACEDAKRLFEEAQKKIDAASAISKHARKQQERCEERLRLFEPNPRPAPSASNATRTADVPGTCPRRAPRATGTSHPSAVESQLPHAPRPAFVDAEQGLRQRSSHASRIEPSPSGAIHWPR